MLKPLVDALPVDCPAIPVHIHDAFVPYFAPGHGERIIGIPSPDKPGIRYNDCVAHAFIRIYVDTPSHSRSEFSRDSGAKPRLFFDGSRGKALCLAQSQENEKRLNESTADTFHPSE